MKRTLILSIVILHILTCRASNYYVKTIGLENGLSQSSVTSLAYDQRGALWIGTRFGINEYRNGKLRDISGGGAGKINDFAEVFEKTGATAALAASLFHFRELTVGEVKEYCRSKNVIMR